MLLIVIFLGAVVLMCCLIAVSLQTDSGKQHSEAMLLPQAYDGSPCLFIFQSTDNKQNKPLYLYPSTLKLQCCDITQSTKPQLQVQRGY
jgi:hypothetical protein